MHVAAEIPELPQFRKNASHVRAREEEVILGASARQLHRKADEYRRQDRRRENQGV